MNNSIPETQAIAGIRLTSPYAQTAVVCPYDFQMVCEYEHDPGEPPVIGVEAGLSHPGWPPNAQLLSCKVGGVEIYDMLSSGQIERIEEAILNQLEG